MHIIGVYNIKGGVGKTATAVNLAYLAAMQGYRTLIWDLDPQAAATYYFRIKPKVKGGRKRLLSGKLDLDDVVKATDFENLDMLPADFSYRNMDLQLEDAKKPTKQLFKLLRPLSKAYDYVLLDCPPSISLVSENIFSAAEGLLLPLIPSTLSLRTYQQLLDFLQGHHITGLELMPFFSMVDRRKRMHLDVMKSLPDKHGELLKAQIPYVSDVEKMGIHRMPVQAFSPNSVAARSYQALWMEVQRRLG
ncbi:MAG: AAA family ATPase [Candidatus Thiodiazotropha sp.]|jgi:chromosome partitioning protein